MSQGINALSFRRYILLQLSGIAGGFLQIVPLIIYYVKLFLLGSTPRSVYNIKNSMRSVRWGTLFPAMSEFCSLLNHNVASKLTGFNQLCSWSSPSPTRSSSP